MAIGHTAGPSHTNLSSSNTNIRCGWLDNKYKTLTARNTHICFSFSKMWHFSDSTHMTRLWFNTFSILNWYSWTPMKSCELSRGWVIIREILYKLSFWLSYNKYAICIEVKVIYTNNHSCSFTDCIKRQNEIFSQMKLVEKRKLAPKGFFFCWQQLKMRNQITW